MSELKDAARVSRPLQHALLDDPNRRKDIRAGRRELNLQLPVFQSKRLMFVCPCMVSIIVNDDQQDATILIQLFIPNQLYMFRAMFSPNVRST